MLVRAGVFVCALACGAAAGALLGGCGGGTQTVSAANAPPTGGASASSTAHPASRPATTAPASPSPAPTTSGRPAAPGGTETATSTTRTATAPAFVHTGEAAGAPGAGGEAARAAATVAAQGYTPVSLSTYHPTQTLRVLVGTRDGSTAGYNQRAFFFLDGRYLGTDASQPSASVRVASQSDTEVTLAYALYRPGDHECCPSGGQATVRFQLNDGQLVPLDPIPPASSAAGLSRQ